MYNILKKLFQIIAIKESWKKNFNYNKINL